MSKTLYIRFSNNSLAFGRYETGTDGAFSYKPWQVRPHTGLVANLHEALATLPMTEGADRTEVVLATQSVVVPLAEFEETDCEHIYDFCVLNDLPHRVFYDTLPAANAVLVYGMTDIVCRAFEDVFHSVHYTSTQMHSLRRLTAYDYRPGGQKRTFIYLHDDSADIAVFDEYRLLFANTFEVADTPDIVYFTFNVADKLSLHPESDAFYLLGPDFLREPAATACRQFAKNVTSVHTDELLKTALADPTAEPPFDFLAAAQR